MEFFKIKIQILFFYFILTNSIFHFILSNSIFYFLFEKHFVVFSMNFNKKCQINKILILFFSLSSSSSYFKNCVRHYLTFFGMLICFPFFYEILKFKFSCTSIPLHKIKIFLKRRKNDISAF